jgi:cell fate (sporulation/competence/biofilm development) regulator YlbF (YheA/YmcA/DUF963 family)
MVDLKLEGIMSKVLDILSKGVSLGNFSHAYGLGITPIIADAVPDIPEIDSLDEAMLKDTVRVKEVSAEGEVPFLWVDNAGDRPVLILDGEELVGVTLKQHRIINTTVIVLSNTSCKIPVSCIEQGRFSYKNMDAKSGQIFRSKSRAVQKQSVTTNLRDNGTYRSNQGAVWREVDTTLREVGAHSPTSSFTDAREVISDRLEQVVRAVKQPVENQIGAVFAARPGILGIEMLATPSLYCKSFQKIAVSFAYEVVLSANLNGELRTKSQDFFEQVVHSEFTRFTSPGTGEDLRIESTDLIGSGLMWGKQVIHLSAFPLNGGEHGSLTQRASIRDRRRNLRSTIE